MENIDVNILPHEDGSAIEPENDKAEKEFNKAIEASEKEVDEINTAEAKPFKEKLILPEDNLLNESEDGWYQSRGRVGDGPVVFNETKFLQDLLNLHKDAAVVNGSDYNQNYIVEDGDIYEKLQDEAHFAIYDLIRKNSTIEEGLNEAIPKELVKPFKNARVTDRGLDDPSVSKFVRGSKYNGYKGIKSKPSQYDGTSNSKIDFSKSNYTPITSDEAKAMKKNGEADKVIAILDGQLVTFNKEGKQLYRAERDYNSDKQKFQRPNGDLMPHSGKLTFGTVIDHAENLYKSNEVVVPDELLINRRNNPESAGYNLSKINTKNISGSRVGITGRHSNEVGYYSTPSKAEIASYRKQVEAGKADIRKIQNILNDQTGKYSEEEKEYQRTWLKSVQDSLKYYTNKLSVAINRDKDLKSRLRYYNSEESFREVFTRLREIKTEISRLTREADDASERVERVKATGSRATRDNKALLANLQSELKDLTKRIIEVEIMLDGCDEDDAEALAEVQSQLEEIEARKSTKQAELDSLLRRNKTESFLESLNEDIPALNKIKDAGKVGDLNDLISDLYPEGITDDQLEDILTYEQDYILDTLGIGDNDE